MSPSIYIIAGPNGVGKTTFAREFLPNYANRWHFISADPIAVALSRIKVGYFDASWWARERLRGSMGTLAFQSYLKLVPVQDPDSFPHITQCDRNANCDILTVKRGGKDGAF
jgi:hypothetical protein